MTEIIYRLLQSNDLDKYRAIRLRCLKEYPDNFGNTYKEEAESKFPKLLPAINGTDANSFAFGAFTAKNELVGICGFVREPRIKTAHRGEVIQMFVDKEFAGKGIGKHLLKHTIDKAFENPEIEQITLSLVYGNKAAEGLYKQMGFVQYGKLDNFFKLGDKYTSQLFMALQRTKHLNEPILSVREIEKKDIEPLTQYWIGSDKNFMQGMGVDISKIPNAEEWKTMLSEQLNHSYKEKKSYCIIWQADGKAIGHSNISKIIFGEEAYMHMHLWNGSVRKKGMGTDLVKMTLPYFFKNMQLKKLCCEPYALNPAPNKTLEKIGFTFIKKYTTVPGWINFEQEVNHWELSYADFNKPV